MGSLKLRFVQRRECLCCLCLWVLLRPAVSALWMIEVIVERFWVSGFVDYSACWLNGCIKTAKGLGMGLVYFFLWIDKIDKID